MLLCGGSEGLRAFIYLYRLCWEQDVQGMTSVPYGVLFEWD